MKLDWKVTLATIATTLLPMTSYYGRTFLPDPYNRFLYYFLIPLGLLWLMGWKAKDHGLQIGNWREGLLWVTAVCAIMGIFLWSFARTPEMNAYYSVLAEHKGSDITQVILNTGIEMFGWEFIWRGFLLFIYARYFGFGAAVFLQAVPFAFMHLGKPELETYSTIFGGAGFGLIAWRTQSMLYPWLIHWFIASLTLFVATTMSV